MGKSKKKDNKKLKRKKKRKPITEIRLKTSDRKSLIAKVHQLNKNKEILKLKKVEELSIKEKTDSMQQEIDKLGGLDAYQYVSRSSESRYGNFNSAKWVIQQLKNHNVWPRKAGTLTLLDVGALDLNYKLYERSLNVTAIDLHPQHPEIEKADFLNYKLEWECIYDVVVLSLVINFCGDPVKRGDMLTHAQQLCKYKGHIFVVLPLACVNNSRYLSRSLIIEMLKSLGCELVTSHNSKKLNFLMVQKSFAPVTDRKFPKKQICDGRKMNNFCIVLR